MLEVEAYSQKHKRCVVFKEGMKARMFVNVLVLRYLFYICIFIHSVLLRRIYIIRMFAC